MIRSSPYWVGSVAPQQPEPLALPPSAFRPLNSPPASRSAREFLASARRAVMAPGAPALPPVAPPEAEDDAAAALASLSLLSAAPPLMFTPHPAQHYAPVPVAPGAPIGRSAPAPRPYTPPVCGRKLVFEDTTDDEEEEMGDEDAFRTPERPQRSASLPNAIVKPPPPVPANTPVLLPMNSVKRHVARSLSTALHQLPTEAQVVPCTVTHQAGPHAFCTHEVFLPNAVGPALLFWTNAFFDLLSLNPFIARFYNPMGHLPYVATNKERHMCTGLVRNYAGDDNNKCFLYCRCDCGHSQIFIRKTEGL